MSELNKTHLASDDPSISAERQILDAIANIGYGSVEITIHDGRIVQIECREKIRLGADAPRKTAVRPIR